MPRFYLPPERCVGPTLTLEGREAHHGLDVLRLRPGEQATVLDGAGRVFDCEVGAVRRRAVELRVRAVQSVAPPLWQVSLLQAIPKGKVFDTIVQKATELGASRIVPLLSERATVRLDQAQAAHKLAHWRRTAIEALKQCGTPWLLRLEAPVRPADFLARGESFELALVGALAGARAHPRAVLEPFEARHGRLPRSVGVWVGPEGDFTPEELAAIGAAGARPVTLGPRVLRSDTAALYLLSILSYEFQARAAA